MFFPASPFLQRIDEPIIRQFKNLDVVVTQAAVGRIFTRDAVSFWSSAKSKPPTREAVPLKATSTTSGCKPMHSKIWAPVFVLS